MLLTDRTVSLTTNPSKTNTCCVRVTVTEKLVIPPQSEMEIMVNIHSKEAGTWLIEGVQFKERPVCVARTLVIPRDQVVPVRVVNLDPLPITLYKNTNIAMAELITDESISSTEEVAENFNTPEPGLVKDVLLQHPLPDELTESQRKQFLSLLSHYSDVIARDPDDLGRTRVLQHCIDTKDASPI